MHPLTRYLLNLSRLTIIAALITLFIKVTLSNVIHFNFFEILFLTLMCGNLLSIKNIQEAIKTLKQQTPAWLSVLVFITVSAICASIKALIFNTLYKYLDLHIFNFDMTYKIMCYISFITSIPMTVNLYFMQENITADQDYLTEDQE